MREQLCKYVELLFAGTSDTEDIRQEILQNSLDKFDDLVAQGKSPEAAYRLTISGIGDINELLSAPPASPQSPSPVPAAAPVIPRSRSKGRAWINAIIGFGGLALYLIVSFLTRGWLVTWLIFPMLGCILGIVRGIFELREAARQ